MRISDVASAAGTTPRTVRHYHRLGLLAEPRRLPNGYRTYELPDLVRLMRIRWLSAAGIPLGSIAAMIEPTPVDARPDDFAEDLSSLIAEIDRKQRVLADQRVRLEEMLSARGAGRVVSPLPVELLSAFDELIASSPTDSVRRLFERERDMWELVAISGTAPPELFSTATRLLSDESDRNRIVDLYRRFAALSGRQVVDVADEIAYLSRELEESLAGVLGDVYSDGDSAGVGFSVGIADLVSDPAQREVVARVAARLKSGGTA
ncbi:MerR family transcriptional regulator [Rhodococcus erythropolis]|uniref:MerR family transcriptional regulator n=1 Tax=Rhodococcus erythropolis TaxID=1833 RepID=UPI001BED0F90|nr:MerR family transcriptional regulator [Rhodococcus erythropolis]MBT2265612.1 MerR family transcriptional regulator [Rhodococcus erythropolis]